ncbi:E3 ubiquitin-protein ligase traf7 [Allomyces javanicus]|nr:E3 ubiquitin-protein ligase traf7 [Allomyces javanicus]
MADLSSTAAPWPSSSAAGSATPPRPFAPPGPSATPPVTSPTADHAARPPQPQRSVSGPAVATMAMTTVAQAAATIPPTIDDEVLFVQQPSLSLMCPICHDVCTDPVITHVCHHSYCAACIAQSLEIEPYCPLCRRRIKADDLHPNLALAGLISELPVYCHYRRYGCTSIVRLDSLDHHTRTCGFAPARCKNESFGCTFSGTAQEVERHVQSSCVFTPLTKYLEVTERRLQQLEETVKHQQAEIGRLTMLLTKHPVTGLLAAVPSDGTLSPAPEVDLDEAMRVEEDPFPAGEIQCRRTIREHTCGVTSVTYHDGTIFSGGHDGSIKIFNAETGTHMKTLTEHRETVWSLAVDDQQQRLFSASKDGTIKVWDLRRARRSSVSSVHTGTTAMTVDGAETARPWSRESAAAPSATRTSPLLLDTLVAHQGKIYSLAIANDDDSQRRLLYSGSGDRTVRVWDLQATDAAPTTSILCVGLFQGHTEGINALRVAGTNLLTASNDKTVRVWDRVTGQCVRTLTLDSEVLDVATCPDAGLIFASTYDATISALDLRSAAGSGETPSAPVAVLAGHNWEVWQLQVYDGTLFSASFDHTIKRWDPRAMACTATLRGHKGFVHALATGRGCLISGCADRTIKIWS